MGEITGLFPNSVVFKTEQFRLMKMRYIVSFVLLCGTALLHAEKFVFQYHRFGDIILCTDKGKESVRIEYEEKLAPLKIIFESRLMSNGSGVFVTPQGTVFTLKHLPKPIINDGNRHINSGDWQLTVSGSGKEFMQLQPKLPPVAFGKNPPFVYLGEKAEAK